MQHINNVLCPDQMLNAIRVRRRSTICTSKRVEDDRRAEFLRHELESRSGGQESTQNVCTSAGSLAMTPPVDHAIVLSITGCNLRSREICWTFQAHPTQTSGATGTAICARVKFPSPPRKISETMNVELHGMLFHLPESSTTWKWIPKVNPNKRGNVRSKDPNSIPPLPSIDMRMSFVEQPISCPAR
ncbi:hypothetical protein ACO22_00556 [Paracoccidioides brasiliensis]|uniref:Uncharacterized protein n=1 Tax=Paracoccidioides brasiliensis TaxID=121759 RepID=A0A1D2JP23_PARBR|nr:hypothetical protein ACO22_00556 [Paracoccidioides brasiliensis]ODH52720.1 hypothetical protein GX48_01209 [Paracoccidioides brasiliensis]